MYNLVIWVIVLGSIRYKNFEQLSLADMLVYEAIPPHPFWDKVSEVVDFSFVDKICEPLYSPLGQRPYAPSLKLKIHLVQRYYDISDREMELKIIGDIFLKRFLGLPITHNKFDHSTIGRDRDRLGAEMIHAAHVFILAQALEKGLWGEQDDRWLIDSFHTNAKVSTPGTYELIQQAVKQVLHLMKRRNTQRYEHLSQQMDLSDFTRKLKNTMSKRERNLALSKLVVQSYSLVAWMERLDVEQQLLWLSEEDRLKSDTNCEVLLRVLRENTTEVPPEDGDTGMTEDAASGPDVERESADDSEPIQFVELAKDKRPTDGVINAYDPEIRCGYKSSSRKFIGDKVQVLESAKSKLVLQAEPIPGNEPDGKALYDVVQSVVEEFGLRPYEVVADKAYAWGKNFERLKQRSLALVAPPEKVVNSTGKIPNTEFAYSPEEHTVTCPMGHSPARSTRSKTYEGTQYIFAKATCEACSLYEECVSTKSDTKKVGRTVFFSDYWPLLQAVRAYIQTDDGKAALGTRYEIERTNNEMKRHHGLREPRTRGRQKLRQLAKLTGIVVNVKRMAKALTDPPRPNMAPVCP